MNSLLVLMILNSLVIGYKFQTYTPIPQSTSNTTLNTFVLPVKSNLSSTSIALICVFTIGSFLIIFMIVIILIKKKKIQKCYFQNCKKETNNKNASKQNDGIYLTQMENQYEKPIGENNQYDLINVSPQKLTNIDTLQNIYNSL